MNNNYNLEKMKEILEKYIGLENDKTLRYSLMDNIKEMEIEVLNCYLDDNHYILSENNEEVYFEKWVFEIHDAFIILYIMDNIIDSICVDR